MAAVNMEHRHIAAAAASDAPDAGDAQSADDRRAYDRLVARFGGRQSDLVRAIGRDQSTVSKWKSRGVPLEAAPLIVDGAVAAGVKLTLHELIDWIMADRRKAA